MTVDMVMTRILKSQDHQVIFDPQNRTMVVQLERTEKKQMVHIIRLEPLIKHNLVAEVVNVYRLFPPEKGTGDFDDASSVRSTMFKPKPSPIYEEKAAAKPQAGDEETDPVMRELELLLSTDAPL